MIKLIGVTGPIGSGKSSLRGVFEELSVPVIDSDELARRAVRPGSPALIELAGEFGNNIMCPDGSLNRKALAEAAFSSNERAARLNAITHPHILKLMHERLSVFVSPYAVIEAPLLFEAELDKECYAVIAVIAPKEDRLRRVQARDGMTAEEAIRRVEIQPGDEFYTSRADYVIENSGDMGQFSGKAREMIRNIIKGTHHD